ncbi:MAG TPA: nitroreductase family deazaflavin-dependent oxidoreductase [Ktedonobacterales bacterium]|nr:nitroreductase family deazaflavin-dependent oxidoreductase [Ktedonobacterales bacterium]
MAKTYRVNFTVRASNALAAALLRMGVPLGPMTLLTVRGRKSGEPRTTPVALTEQDGRRIIVGTFGDVNWVRNLRAAGEAALTRGRRSEHVTVRELSAEEAAPLLKRALSGAPGMVRGYFDVTPDSSLEAFVREAPRHPVFLVTPVRAAATDADARASNAPQRRAS